MPPPDEAAEVVDVELERPAVVVLDWLGELEETVVAEELDDDIVEVEAAV